MIEIPLKSEATGEMTRSGNLHELGMWCFESLHASV